MPAPASADEVCTMRIELRGTRPVIWREVEVPTATTLAALHRVIQAAMGWLDYHLWEFTIDGRTYGPPMEEDWGAEPRISAGKVRLRDVLKPRRTTIHYMYDFGDDWEHKLIVTKVRQGDPTIHYPRYVAGEWNAPPEDCGGVPGFYDALVALGDPAHPDHEMWVGAFGDYDPKVIDEASIRAGLARLGPRRARAKAPGRSPKVWCLPR